MRTHLPTALLFATLATGCADPLENCEWAASEVGQYQQRTSGGGCLALNLDPSQPLIGMAGLDVDLIATAEQGDVVEVVSGRRTAVVDEDLACFYTERDAEAGCDSIRIACGEADGSPSAPLVSTRVRILVNGEEEASLFVVSERFAAESDLID